MKKLKFKYNGYINLLSASQSIAELLCKSIGWFLYEGNTGTWWVKLMKREI